MSLAATELGWRFVAACRDPERHQRALLRELLARHADTDFGRAHGLSARMTFRDFARSVPIRRCSELAPWLSRAARGERCVLTVEPPRWFARSSGTTGAAKYLPITRSGLRAYQTVRDLWLRRTLELVPEAARGTLLLLSSPHDEEQLPGGATALRQSVVTWVPPRARAGRGMRVPEPGERHRLHESSYDDVSMIVATSPSTIVVWLEAAASQMRSPWPELALIACWTEGPSALYAEQIAKLSGGTPVHDIGLPASEGYFAVPIERKGPAILAVGSYVIELVPADDTPGEPVPWADIEPGNEYRLVVTTPSGLWRYDTEDVVEVVGRLERTPGVAFRRRAGAVVSIAGEKITEQQVVEAACACSAEHGLEIRDFVCRLVWPIEGAPRYQFSVVLDGSNHDAGALAAGLERWLCRLNGEYRSRRQGDRIAAAEVLLVSGRVRPPGKPVHLVLDLPERGAYRER